MKNTFLFKRGDYWHLEYFDEVENRKRRVSTKCKLKSDAMRFLTNFKVQAATKNKIKHISLNQFKNEYQDYVKHNLSVKYYNDVRTTFKKLEERFGDISLIKINSFQLERFLSERYLESKFAAKHHFNNLRSAFNKAIKWGYLPENPVSKIRSPKVPKNNPSFINKAELQFILDKEKDLTLRNIYSFAFYTGMRLAEIVFLKWEHISLKPKNIRVMNTEEFTTKGQKERIVPMSKQVIKIVKSIKYNRSNYVFTKDGLRFNPDYISKKFKSALKEAAKDSPINPSIHFHDLRHSFASSLAQMGVSLFVIKELLGHTDIKTTMIYSHLQPENLRSAIDLL